MSRVQDILLVIGLAVTAPASAATLFDVSVDLTTAGPPYPTSPTQTKLFQGNLPSPPQVGAVNLGIHDVTGTSLAAHVHAWDPAGGPGALSESSFFDVYLETSQPTPPPMSHSFFDIWLEPLTSHGLPGAILSGGGRIVGSAGGGTFRSYFDVSLNVVMDGGAPRLLVLHGEVPEGQSVYFASGGSIQLVDSRLHIIPKIVFAGPVNNASPLIQITMTPEPASILCLFAGTGLLRRSRQVTRFAT